MSHFVLQTRTSDLRGEQFGDCQCAVVQITPRLMRSVRRRMKLARSLLSSDGDLIELRFWDDRGVSFYPFALVCKFIDVDSEFELQFEELGFAPLPDQVSLESYLPTRTPAQRMIVQIDYRAGIAPTTEVSWCTMPFCADLTISTIGLSSELLSELATPCPVRC